MFSRLLYVSQADHPTTIGLQRILVGSRAKNHAADITGGMCLYGDVFFQCLEGSPNALDETYFRIEQDPRHRNVRLLYRQDAPRRLFPGFRLALLTWNLETRQTFESFLKQGDMDLYDIRPHAAVDLLEAVVRSPNWSEV